MLNPPKADERGNTRQKLIDAAVALFLTAGYEDLRIREITGHAGVGKGTFYLYFKDKRDLLLAYFRYATELVDTVSARTAAPDRDYFAREALRMKASTEQGVRWNSMITFLRVSAGSPDPEVAAAARQVRRRIAAFPRNDLEEAVRAGVIRAVDPELATLMIVGMVEALAWRSRQDDRYSAASISAFLSDLHVRTLAPLAHEDELRARVSAMLQASELLEQGMIDADLPPEWRAHKAWRVERAGSTRERLIDAAADLLHEVGYHHLRVGDSTDRAGVGKGTFYHHFASKQDLLLAIFRRVTKDVGAVESWITAAGPDHLARVALRMRLALTPGKDWDRIVTFLRSMANSPAAEVAAGAWEALRSLADPMRKDLEEAMRQGLVRDLDPELAAMALLGMQETLVWRVGEDGAPGVAAAGAAAGATAAGGAAEGVQTDGTPAEDAYDRATVLAFMADMYCRAFLAEAQLRPQAAEA